MSKEDSIFTCKCCGEKIEGKREAYRHIRLAWGLFIDDAQTEETFLLEKSELL